MFVNTLILFGAGKIGRSFIAQIFARNGYEVVFIDLDMEIIQAINKHKRYSVLTLNNDGSKSEYWVEGIRAIDGRDHAACINLLLEASLVATSVGAGAIPAVCKIIAAALKARRDKGLIPFDLILAENMRDAAAFVRQQLVSHDLPISDHPGLIEASIGKTSPNVPANERADDPLLVYGDSYNTLILSANGWRGDPPQFPELYLAASISAYIDRKLFVHNLAHCALAYFGYQVAPELTYIHEVLTHNAVRSQVEGLIDISIQAVQGEYPGEFTDVDMRQYKNDVFERISNPALLDTLWRIGRDIPRKLGRTERIVGSLLLALRQGLSSNFHIQLYESALSFYASDETGKMAPMDRKFHSDLCLHGLAYVLFTVSGFDDTVSYEESFVDELKQTVCLNKIFT